MHAGDAGLHTERAGVDVEASDIDADGARMHPRALRRR
jgi:hypothetical protein